MTDNTRKLQDVSTRHVLRTAIEPSDDLRQERGKATFSVPQMIDFLNGGAEKTKRRRYLIDLLSSNPTLSNRSQYHLSRTELYTTGLKQVAAFNALRKQLNLSYDNMDDVDDTWFMRGAMGFVLPDDVHHSMFLSTIKGQGTDEQVTYWLPRAENYEIVGTYAQTELAHGTFVRGLETTATFDRNTGEYILHTPRLASMKWWPGGLGKTANHCVLMARLMIEGKDHGPHPFIVQLRDLGTHELLPGVRTGDIGPKYGFNGIDNGFLSFNHVRIPRTALLMRYASVSPDGKYQRHGHAKAGYATMVLIRVGLVGQASRTLGKALTVAIRYSAVRRQTTSSPTKPESKILDYQNQQYELFGLLSTSYALHFTALYMRKMYFSTLEQIQQGDFSGLPQLHATSAGLKAVCTWLASSGIEVCRRSCGGHGYSEFSGLPRLFSNYIPVITLEGDNNVMCLQTARYLIKCVRKIASDGEPFPRDSDVAYLNLLSEGPVAINVKEAMNDPSLLQRLFAWRAAFCVSSAANALQESLSSGMSMSDAWNACSVMLIQGARSHCMHLLVQNFFEYLSSADAPTELGGVLDTVAKLFAFHQAELCVGDLLENGSIDRADVPVLRQHVIILLNQLRPNAVALCDGFGLSDYELNSALGAYDGDVYRRLFARAQEEPLNRSDVVPGIRDFYRAHQAIAKL